MPNTNVGVLKKTIVGIIVLICSALILAGCNQRTYILTTIRVMEPEVLEELNVGDWVYEDFGGILGSSESRGPVREIGDDYIVIRMPYNAFLAYDGSLIPCDDSFFYRWRIGPTSLNFYVQPGDTVARRHRVSFEAIEIISFEERER